MPNKLGLRHGRLELPGHRALVWHIMDNDPWRKASCPRCGEGFIVDPRLMVGAFYVHWECEFPGETREPVPPFLNIHGRAVCICGCTVLPENWPNHLLSQIGGPHGKPDLPPMTPASEDPIP